MNIKIGVLAMAAGFAGAVLFSQSLPRRQTQRGKTFGVAGILGLIALGRECTREVSQHRGVIR
jgi:hypothetical protein